MFIQNLNKICDVKHGETILDVLIREKIEIQSICNGNGSCGKCKIKIVNSDRKLHDVEKKLLTAAEIEEGYRLACRVKARFGYNISISNNSYKNNKDRKSIITKQAFHIFNNDEIINNQNATLLENKDALTYHRFGVAFDIGTTTIVGMLWCLDNHTLVNTVSLKNSQSIFGADIISRARYANLSSFHQKKLQECVIHDCNEILNRLSTIKYSGTIEKIYFVGNVIMSHLLLRYSTKNLVRYPFTPFFTGIDRKRVDELGILINNNEQNNIELRENTGVVILPNIGGHIGSDILAGIFCLGLNEMNGTYLLIDIGTNGEIVLVKKDKIITCSTAAGPAFEGASIYQGMQAMEGAIEKIEINCSNHDNGGKEKNNYYSIQCHSIGNQTPIGICGSGLIDAVAELIKAGLLERTGRMITKEEAIEKGICNELCERLLKTEQGWSFLLYKSGETIFHKNGEKIDKIQSINLEGKDIIITQKDIREIQLAKAAIYGGIITLLNKLELSIEQIDKIFIAGTFGNYLDKDNAVKIGLLPEFSIKEMVNVGNTAGYGAAKIMLHEEQLDYISKLARKIEQVELSLQEDFQSIYIDSMNF